MRQAVRSNSTRLPSTGARARQYGPLIDLIEGLSDLKDEARGIHLLIVGLGHEAGITGEETDPLVAAAYRIMDQVALIGDRVESLPAELKAEPPCAAVEPDYRHGLEDAIIVAHGTALAFDIVLQDVGERLVRRTINGRDCYIMGVPDWQMLHQLAPKLTGDVLTVEKAFFGPVAAGERYPAEWPGDVLTIDAEGARL